MWIQTPIRHCSIEENMRIICTSQDQDGSTRSVLNIWMRPWQEWYNMKLATMQQKNFLTWKRWGRSILSDMCMVWWNLIKIKAKCIPHLWLCHYLKSWQHMNRPWGWYDIRKDDKNMMLASSSYHIFYQHTAQKRQVWSIINEICT